MRFAIVPPYLLARIARLDDPRFAATAEAARRAVKLDVPFRTGREQLDSPAVDDSAVNEAHNGLGHTEALFREVYSRASMDDCNLPLLATVHYGAGPPQRILGFSPTRVR